MFRYLIYIICLSICLLLEAGCSTVNINTKAKKPEATKCTIAPITDNSVSNQDLNKRLDKVICGKNNISLKPPRISNINSA